MFNLFSRGPAAGQVTAAEAIKLVADGDMTLIDVRDITEVNQTGKAQGALHIPMMMMRFQADPKNPDFNKSLDTGKKTGVYCATGARSGMAVRMLQQLGFTDVHNIGGLQGWYAAGGKITR
jgi:rhodanese-related sulfurtransferase